MTGIICGLLVVLCAVCVIAIPSSLLTDVKQAEMSRARLTNKVKRAQEVIMFGNQQNRGGDGRNGFALPRTEKRGVELEDNVLPESVTEQPRIVYSPETDDSLEEPKVLAQYEKNFRLGEPEYSQRLQNSVLKSEYYTDPAPIPDLRYYDLDERQKRETFRASEKSRELAAAGRAKRDLDIDPEELLALITLWERRNKPLQNRYNPYSTIDSEDKEPLDDSEGANDISEDDDLRPSGISDGWMDGPMALPYQVYNVPGIKPWDQRGVAKLRKRFMVSKRRAQGSSKLNDITLAQLLKSPRRDNVSPDIYRFLL